MWKLTIEQKIPNEYEGKEFYSTEKITFKSNDLSELTMLIEKCTHCESAGETSYKLEKVGKEE